MKGKLLKEYVKRIADLEFAIKVLVAESECYCTDNVAANGTCAWCHAKGTLEARLYCANERRVS